MSSLAYDRSGSGEPLVLLHPLGGDRRVWRPVLPMLTPYRDVVVVDLPGFGGSAALADEQHPAALAVAVGGLLRELKIDGGRAHLAGNSLGGWVALELALAGHAASVTAIAPAGFWPRGLPPKPEIARTIARMTRPALNALVRTARGRRLALLGSVAHPDRVPAHDAAALIEAYADAPGFSRVNSAMRAGTFGRLAEVGVPVTLVWPDRDRLVARPGTPPAHVREIVLHDAGHIPMWDNPQEVADALLAGSSRGADSLGATG